MAPDFDALSRHPAAQEGVTLQHEVVLGQPHRLIHRGKAPFGIGRHHMGLDGLLFVVFLEGHKILHGELAARAG